MPKLILKSGYLKPINKKRSGFLEYIAKRDGVIQSIQNNKNKPATSKQQKLIKQLAKQLPIIKKYSEYETYSLYPTLGNASELITSIEESHFSQLNQVDGYINYIANRPRVTKLNHHGLFTSSNDPIVLSQVTNHIKEYKGIIFTQIASLKREDATRLGYDNPESWKLLISSLQNQLAIALKIDPINFQWYGAYHDEGHHPHVHLVMFSKDGKQGYQSKQGIDKMRSLIAKEIFAYEMLPIYKQQTHYRDQVKIHSEAFIENRIDQINDSLITHTSIDSKMIELSNKLKLVSGKKKYGYLPKPIKKLIDEIVNELSNTPQVKEMMSLWYEQRNAILETYSSILEKPQHLSDIEAFKPIKNIIIDQALKIDLKYERNTLIEDEVIVRNDVPSMFHISVVDHDATNEKLQNNHVILNNDNFNSSDNSVSNENLITPSIRLLYHVSRIFLSDITMQNQQQTHESKLLSKLKEKKLSLGHNSDDSHKF